MTNKRVRTYKSQIDNVSLLSANAIIQDGPKNIPMKMDDVIPCPVKGCEWKRERRYLATHRKEVHTL